MENDLPELESEMQTPPKSPVNGSQSHAGTKPAFSPSSSIPSTSKPADSSDKLSNDLESIRKDTLSVSQRLAQMLAGLKAKNRADSEKANISTSNESVTATTSAFPNSVEKLEETSEINRLDEKRPSTASISSFQFENQSTMDQLTAMVKREISVRESTVPSERQRLETPDQTKTSSTPQQEILINVGRSPAIQEPEIAIEMGQRIEKRATMPTGFLVNPTQPVLFQLQIVPVILSTSNSTNLISQPIYHNTQTFVNNLAPQNDVPQSENGASESSQHASKSNNHHAKGSRCFKPGKFCNYCNLEITRNMFCWKKANVCKNCFKQMNYRMCTDCKKWKQHRMRGKCSTCYAKYCKEQREQRASNQDEPNQALSISESNQIEVSPISTPDVLSPTSNVQSTSPSKSTINLTPSSVTSLPVSPSTNVDLDALTNVNYEFASKSTLEPTKNVTSTSEATSRSASPSNSVIFAEALPESIRRNVCQVCKFKLSLLDGMCRNCFVDSKKKKGQCKFCKEIRPIIFNQRCRDCNPRVLKRKTSDAQNISIDVEQPEDNRPVVDDVVTLGTEADFLGINAEQADHKETEHSKSNLPNPIPSSSSNEVTSVLAKFLGHNNEQPEGDTSTNSEPPTNTIPNKKHKTDVDDDCTIVATVNYKRLGPEDKTPTRQLTILNPCKQCNTPEILDTYGLCQLCFYGNFSSRHSRKIETLDSKWVTCHDCGERKLRFCDQLCSICYYARRKKQTVENSKQCEPNSEVAEQQVNNTCYTSDVQTTAKQHTVTTPQDESSNAKISEQNPDTSKLYGNSEFGQQPTNSSTSPNKSRRLITCAGCNQCKPLFAKDRCTKCYRILRSQQIREAQQKQITDADSALLNSVMQHFFLQPAAIQASTEGRGISVDSSQSEVRSVSSGSRSISGDGSEIMLLEQLFTNPATICQQQNLEHQDNASRYPALVSKLQKSTNQQTKNKYPELTSRLQTSIPKPQAPGNQQNNSKFVRYGRPPTISGYSGIISGNHQARFIRQEVASHQPTSNRPTRPDTPSARNQEATFTTHSSPAEQTLYCTCRQRSQSAMIQCDNSACSIGWYHFECVNLRVGPPANLKWYCFLCRPHFLDGHGLMQNRSDPQQPTLSNRNNVEELGEEEPVIFDGVVPPPTCSSASEPPSVAQNNLPLISTTSTKEQTARKKRQPAKDIDLVVLESSDEEDSKYFV